MKARKLLKILFTMTAVFAFTATFAQENAPWQDMDGTSADAETDSVVVGMTIPYYVEPDPVLNSLPDLYDPSQSNGDQGIESTFSWEETTGNGTVIIDPPSGDNDAPYREIIFEDAASYTIGVTESNAAGCDGDQETQEVLAIEEPSYTINTTSYEICDGETQSILVDDITANFGGWSSFYFMMDIEKTIVDGENTYTHNDTIVSVGASEGTDIALFEDKLFTADEDGGEKQVTEYTFTVSGM
ncbi:MAG: hypothetical protein ACLFMM_09845, partial [Methanohalobium sp.]|uniref:hypothetical protein n=1 Tax=Methanohalobium sp. TaxID=2837493 RepID=UPI00397933AB